MVTGPSQQTVGLFLYCKRAGNSGKIAEKPVKKVYKISEKI